MIIKDENALICDLAETYNIYDYKKIAPSKVAVFSIGLRETSRIKMKMANQELDFNSLMIAKLVDNTNLLIWAKTKDAQTGANKPKSILHHLFDSSEKISAFASGKEYEIAKRNIINERSE